MSTTNQSEVINNFIIETVLISPIEKILSQLNNNEFRDCDIKWLDVKLKNFIDFAAETLYLQTPSLPEREEFKTFNAYVKNHYTEKFQILLNYFKSF